MSNKAIEEVKGLGERVKSFKEETDAQITDFKSALEAKAQRIKALEDETATAKEKMTEAERKLEELREKVRSNPAAGVDGMDPEKYSLAKALMALTTGDWKEAGYEKEVNEACIKAAGAEEDPNLALLLPKEVQERVIPLQRENLVLNQMGVEVISGLAGNQRVEIPKETKDGDFYHVGPNAAVGEDDEELGVITLEPHTIASARRLMRRLLQAGVGAENYLRGKLGRGITRGIQKMYFQGTGQNGQPLGILNRGNQLGVDFSDSKPTIPLLQKMVALVEDNNEDSDGDISWVFNRMGQWAVEQIETSDTVRGALPIWSRGDIQSGSPPMLLGHRYYRTKHVPRTVDGGQSNEDITDLLLGQWNMTAVATWGNVLISRHDQYLDAVKKREAMIVVMLDYEIAVLQDNVLVIGSNVQYQA